MKYFLLMDSPWVSVECGNAQRTSVSQLSGHKTPETAVTLQSAVTVYNQLTGEVL